MHAVEIISLFDSLSLSLSLGRFIITMINFPLKKLSANKMCDKTGYFRLTLPFHGYLFIIIERHPPHTQTHMYLYFIPVHWIILSKITAKKADRKWYNSYSNSNNYHTAKIRLPMHFIKLQIRKWNAYSISWIMPIWIMPFCSVIIYTYAQHTIQYIYYITIKQTAQLTLVSWISAYRTIRISRLFNDIYNRWF